ncbi:phosphatidylinositol-specific phospholipase C domain-containing protein [Streptomyces tremellae]|uniref:Phosphatidylinositol-specific phospholipase C domain-containing protein n=1 Tax=Streptomyces tremellae TaxID=1124239 RepID=A0ABP7FUI5_9ACTN
MARSVRAATVAGAAALVALLGSPASAADVQQLPYSRSTAVGIHNTYDPAAFPYLADGLDTGAGLIELDTWTNLAGPAFRVSHDPVGNSDNCTGATTVAGLTSGSTDKDLAGCLTDLKTWSDAHPDHAPVVVKVEMKDGFLANQGRGPDEFDALVNSKLGGSVFRPADLTGGTYPTLDAAATAGAWPTRAQLRGKFVFELIPGTVEEQNPFDHLWTDQEYATHLRDLQAAGNLAQAAAFPAVHTVNTPGDPRTRYADTTLRPWFVFFDTDANGFVTNGIDLDWYDENHYFVVLTDAQNVAPAIDGTNPTEQEARDRLGLLAQDHASIVSADWRSLPSVDSAVVPRGWAQ